MEFNMLHFMWISYSFIVTFSGLNVLYKKNIPSIFIRLYAFGKSHKSLKKQNSILTWLEIPKRWFSHFYVFAAVYFPVITIAVLRRYYNKTPSWFFVYLLNVCSSSNREATTQPESVILLSILLTLQVCRRCYECFCISVYSDSKMNVLHYIVGFTFYFGVGLSLLHDAPGFQKPYGDNVEIFISNEWFTVAHCIGTILFLLGFVSQFQAHKTLAQLRKTGNKITSVSHHMPTGGLFEWVSCPHYFAEILIYLSGCIILGGRSYSWWLVCLWTVTNQVLTGIMNHQWYHKTFQNYPTKRKAVIPFLI